MKKISFPCLLFALIFFGTTASAQYEYPAWFLYPAQNSNALTGFSYFGAPPVIDAERMYCVYRSVTVEGTLELFHDVTEDDFFRNSDYYYYFSPDSLAQIADSLHMLDQFANNVLVNDRIGVFSTDSTAEVDTRLINIDSMAAPRWSQETFWKQDDYYYGVGSYTLKGNENGAWKTAEERAIFTILTSVAMQVHSLQGNVEETGSVDQFDRLQFIRLRYLLRNIEPLERWVDKENRQCQVLVRVAVNDIVSPH